MAPPLLSNTKQPKALPILFFTEMWERYGFYAIQALLVLYLTSSLHFNDAHAYALYAAFSSLLYASTVIGGYIADKVLGFRKSIFLGGILYIIGYFLIIAPSTLTFHLALALLIIANGYFKANISSLLGVFYEKDDPRRKSGFTLFYMGINLGALLGPLVSSFVAKHYGYPAGLGTAAIGMIFGMIILLAGSHYFGKRGILPLECETKNKPAPPAKNKIWVYIGSIIAIPIFMILIEHTVITNWLLAIFSVSAVCFVLYHIFKLHEKQRQKLFSLLVLMVFSVLFWAFFMQMFLSVTLFIQRNVDRTIFSYTIPTGSFVSLEGFYILIFSPFFAALWQRLAGSRFMPSTPMKFSYALIFLGLCFLVLRIASGSTDSNLMVSGDWLILAYLLLTFGELLLSPIGLSAVTELSPPKLVGVMMGIWFLTIAIGLALAGQLASFAAVPKAVTSALGTLHIYQSAFGKFTYMAIGCGILLALLSPFLKRMMREQ